ncbi:permease [archaeon SCG-AAA382B04]|nr:permease [archaeon SCG-AAA382B04]
MDKKEYLILTIIATFSIVIGKLATETPLDHFLITKAIESAKLTAIMFWETWWALVLGFVIAGAVESWVSKEKITNYLEGEGLKELGIATFFGFVSSSCSFSAIATAKNLFKKGASAAASLAAFMFASTNLVIEIGLVMFVLLGWQFVLADFVGGILLILMMAFIFKYLIPDVNIERARQHVINQEGVRETDPVCGMDVDINKANYVKKHDGKKYYFCSKKCMESFDPSRLNQKSIKENITSLEGWKSLADKQIKEWGMLYDDIILGFILAGIIGAFIPKKIWISIFEGAILDVPFSVLLLSAISVGVGIITFVCSVGNVPFAAVLWSNGLPFGSVLSFIYADLIIPPIMDAYKKYYGLKFAAILILTIFLSATITGSIIHHLFNLANLIPQISEGIAEREVVANYKVFLNLVFTVVFVFLYYLHKK